MSTKQTSPEATPAAPVAKSGPPGPDDPISPARAAIIARMAKKALPKRIPEPGRKPQECDSEAPQRSNGGGRNYR